MNYAGSKHSTHVDVVRDSSIKDDDEVSVLVNKNVGALRANTGGCLDRQQNDQLLDWVEPVSTALVIL